MGGRDACQAVAGAQKEGVFTGRLPASAGRVGAGLRPTGNNVYRHTPSDVSIKI